MSGKPGGFFRDLAPAISRSSIAPCAVGLTVIIGSGFGFVYFAVWDALDGAFSYSLDDPYIHLALAENLLKGHYGINLGEASAPSSSILFPVLLAAGLLLQLGPFGPLVLNVLASIGIVLILMKIVHGDDRLAARADDALGVAVVVTLAVATNILGVAFTGMEHSLHIMTSLAVLYGLIRTVETGNVPGWMPAALVANPLLRFEGLALTGATLLALAWLGHWRTAVTTGVLTVLLVGGFMAALATMGLGPLPSSVLAKSTMASASMDRQSATLMFIALLANLYRSLDNGSGILLVLLAAFLFVKPLKDHVPGRRNPEAAIALASGVAIVAHLAFGRYGMFARYEIYALFLGLAALIYLWRIELRSLFYSKHARATRLLLFVAFIAVTFPYWKATVFTYQGSLNIHLQQHQMHRFATEFLGERVAVNDIGSVSYRNESYVLDLWGLGSEEARRLRKSGGRDTAEWLDRIARDKGIHVAMIYRDWFERIPARWTPLGELVMDAPRRTSDRTAVHFYATPVADGQAVIRALAAFAASLPPRARFVWDARLDPAR